MTYQLFQGDCLDVMAEIPDGSVDLTVTSPPYDNLRTYNGNNDQWGEHVWKQVLSELFRVTKPGGVVVWVVADATINGSETGTSFRQALWAMECGFNVETMIYEQAGTGAKGSNYYYWQSFEYMFVWTRGNPKTSNRLTYKNRNAGKPRGFRAKSARLASRVDRVGYINPELSVRSNVWRYAVGQDVSFGHPAPFPESLASDHILSWSNPGDTVLDPFLGSGTTGKMAVLTGRNFIGVELDEGYFQIAQSRIAKAAQMAAGEFVTLAGKATDLDELPLFSNHD